MNKICGHCEIRHKGNSSCPTCFLYWKVKGLKEKLSNAKKSFEVIIEDTPELKNTAPQNVLMGCKAVAAYAIREIGDV